MSVKERLEETGSGLKHETERKTGENKRHRDARGNIRCWGRMERGVTKVAAVGSVTSLS